MTYLTGVDAGYIVVVLVVAGEVVILLIVVPINVVTSDVTSWVDREAVGWNSVLFLQFNDQDTRD